MTAATAPRAVTGYVVSGLDTPLVYIETTIPAGMTIDVYRRGRPRRPSRWERLKHLAGDSRVYAAAAA